METTSKSVLTFNFRGYPTFTPRMHLEVRKLYVNSFIFEHVLRPFRCAAENFVYVLIHRMGQAVSLQSEMSLWCCFVQGGRNVTVLFTISQPTQKCTEFGRKVVKFNCNFYLTVFHTT